MAGGGTKRMVLAVSCVGIFLVLVRTDGLNPALPHIEEEFGAGVAGPQWAVNAYALAVGCLLLSAGALAPAGSGRQVPRLPAGDSLLLSGVHGLLYGLHVRKVSLRRLLRISL